MKWSVKGMAALAAALLIQAGLVADEEKVAAPAAPEAAACQPAGCDNCGHWLLDVEMTFLKLHRADDFDDSDDVFGFDASPRVTVGYIGDSGLGARLRWWSYNHADRESDGDRFSVNTYNLDLELFQPIQLSRCTVLEWSAGYRHNSFDFFDGDADGSLDIDGNGIVFGLKVIRKLTDNSALYAGIRHAWIMGDIEESGENDDSFDSTLTQFEGDIGYLYTMCLSNGSVLTFKAGFEMQNWTNYDDFDDEDEAIGFGGFVLGAGLRY